MSLSPFSSLVPRPSPLDMNDAAQIDLDLAFAVDAARAAGKRLLEVRSAARWKGKTLGDVGDQAADNYLQGLLRGARPQDGVLSEETKDSRDRLGRERVWIVDPLDGTREFSQGREDWGVHVALTAGGRCALAAVALPSVGQLLWGVCLPGHERSGIEGEARLVRGDPPARSRKPRMVISRSHTPPWVDTFRASLGAASVRRWGSAGYKTALLLLGRADVYVHDVGLKEWDTCAPETVARALGWSVCRLDGSEHAYNQPNPKNQQLVVCRPDLRERVLEAWRSVVRAGLTRGPA
jgi:3'(2'), 5'-bisphosphate nucleotidase